MSSAKNRSGARSCSEGFSGRIPFSECMFVAGGKGFMSVKGLSVCSEFFTVCEFTTLLFI